MAKITISQLHTVNAGSIQELTNSEIDTTKGGLPLVSVDVVSAIFGTGSFAIDTVGSATSATSSTQRYLSEDLARSLGLV